MVPVLLTRPAPCSILGVSSETHIYIHTVPTVSMTTSRADMLSQLSKDICTHICALAHKYTHTHTVQREVSVTVFYFLSIFQAAVISGTIQREKVSERKRDNGRLQEGRREKRPRKQEGDWLTNTAELENIMYFCTKPYFVLYCQ